MALVTLSQVKTQLGITDSAEDALLTQILGQVDAWLKTYTHQALEQASYVEYHDGSNTTAIRVRQRPLVSITNVWVDPDGAYGQAAGAFGTETLLTAGTDYCFRPDQPDGSSRTGLLYRVRGVWPGGVSRGSGGFGWAAGGDSGLLTAAIVAGRGNIKVSYTGGFAAVPADLQLAICLAVARVRNTRQYGSVLRSQSYENYSYSLEVSLDLFSSSKDVLKRYRGLE